MRILRWTFGILSLCGCWPPFSWSSPLKKFLYNIYTVFLTSITYFITTLQLMEMLLNVRDQDDFSDAFYLLVANLNSSYKMYCILGGRRRIANLCNLLERKPFAPRAPEEMEIRRRFDRISRFNTICYTFVVEFTVVWISFAALSANIKSRKLPYKMWLPQNYSSALYGAFYVQQVIALTTGSLTQIACDSLISGLLIHVCGQIDILGCRLKAIQPDDIESAWLSSLNALNAVAVTGDRHLKFYFTLYCRDFVLGRKARC